MSHEDVNQQRSDRADRAEFERIARIEVGLVALTEEMRALRVETGALREALGRAMQRPPISWPAVISSGVALAILMLALYAAAVRPLEIRVEHSEQTLDDRTEVLQDIRNTQAQVLARLTQHEHEIQTLQNNGTPSIAARLAVIENVLKIPR